MAYVTRDYAISVMRKNNVKYWKLISEGSCIGESQEDVELEESISDLESALDAVSSGWVEVRANIKKAKELATGGDVQKGSYKFKISISDNSNKNNNSGGGGGGNFNWMEKYFDEKSKRERMEIEVSFDKKFAELSGQGDSGDKFLDKIMKIMELEYLKGNKGSVQTLSDKPVVQKTKAEATVSGMNNKEKVLEALTKLNAIDENPADNLLKLAKWAEENPELYKAYLENLK